MTVCVCVCVCQCGGECECECECGSRPYSPELRHLLARRRVSKRDIRNFSFILANWVCVFVDTSVGMRGYVGMLIYVRGYACMCVSAYVDICAYAHAHMHICIHINT